MRIFAEGLTSHDHSHLWIVKIKPLAQCIVYIYIFL